MKTITILGKEYTKPTLNFKGVCELEKYGFDFSRLDKQMFNSTAILFAFVTKVSLDNAMETLENNADSYNEIATSLFEIVSESDFFKKMSKK